MSALIAHYADFETDELLGLFETPENFTAEAISAIDAVLKDRGVRLPERVVQSSAEDDSSPVETDAPRAEGKSLLGWLRRRRPEVSPEAADPIDPNQRAALEEEGGRGFTDLMKAAADGDVARLRQLVESGAELDERDRRGGTALAYAARYGQRAAVEFLLSCGADPGIRTAAGRTPGQLARGNGYSEIAALLDSLAPPTRGCCAGGCMARG